jgi:hypothetical protein
VSLKTVFGRSIRGWLPEEPKMPKSKLERILQPIAVLVAATTVVSLFSSIFMVSQPIAALSTPLVVRSTPGSSLVEFEGVLQQNNTFIMVLTNGTHITSKSLTMTFSVTEKGGNECTAHLAVECDGFSNETSVDGSIVDGNLVIDSTRSIFLINPNHDLSGTRRIVLTETDDWRLTATVDTRTGKPSTAVEPYGVTALMVSAHNLLTEEGWPMCLILGYDPASGMLVYSGYSLSDVLLKKVGIELLLGGSLELVSYSDDLNLEFFNWDLFWAKLNTRVFLFYLHLSLLVVLAVVVVVLFVIRKIRKRRRVGALNVPELHDNSTQNCDKRGW